MNTQKLLELIKAFDEFLMTDTEGDLETFAFWLLKQREHNTPPYDSDLNRNLNYLLNRINRHSKILAKQYLAGLEINSLEEYCFLNSIKQLKNPSKSEVYEHTLTELATGQQMMRRLISLGLIEDFEDDYDKRVRRVRLTAKGHTVQTEAYKRLGEESNFKFGKLDRKNKENLLQVLRWLEQNLRDKW